MSALFDEGEINGMALSNRLVRSATWEGMCGDDGRPTGKLIDLYGTLARGGVGLLISGYAFVREEGKQLPGKMGFHRDAFANEMKSMTAAVHDAGGKICVQLVHAGGQTDAATAGRRPLAPSSVKVEQFPEMPDEMTLQDIGELIDAFAESARRAKAWDFDAIQLHAAHGYLINQFLSPLTNRRSDKYGGNAENRRRFLMEVHEAVRGTVGPHFPVMIKLNCADHLDGGLETGDALDTARTLDQAGIDAIEVSAGTPASGRQSPARTKIKHPEQEAYNLDLARQVKEAVSCPVMVVGGLRSLDVVEAALNGGGADYISLSRPLIREPDLPNRWKSGNREPAHCRSCNECFKPGLQEGGIYCVTLKKEQEKKAARAEG